MYINLPSFLFSNQWSWQLLFLFHLFGSRLSWWLVEQQKEELAIVGQKRLEAGPQESGSCAGGRPQEVNEFPAVFGRGGPGTAVWR